MGIVEEGVKSQVGNTIEILVVTLECPVICHLLRPEICNMFQNFSMINLARCVLS